MRRLLLILVSMVHVQAAELYLDQFHGFQNLFVLHLESPLDVQESLVLGVNVLNISSRDVNFKMSLWEGSYRRYINETTLSGIFYSFGVRAGMVNLSSEFYEQELSVMPFYDIGIKGQLSDRWFHILRLEAGYFMLYSKDINIDHVLGLQFTPFFSFGYRLD